MTFKQFLKLKIVLHVLHWITVVCIGLCVCFIALLYISGTGWFRDYLDTYLQKQIASHIHGTITWNHLWIRQPFTLVVTGITVATDDSRPVITVESIKARVSILQLLRKHITIARCTVNGGYVVYDNDIHPNLVDIFNIKKSTSQRDVPFSIQKYTLKNMRIVYHDSLHHIHVHSSGVDVAGRLFSFKQFNANCSVHSGTVNIGNVTFSMDSAFAAIQKKKNSFTIKRFLCRSNSNATAEGSLNIPAKKSGKWAGTFTVSGDSAFVSLLPLARSGIRSCSGFLMKAAINGTMQHPQMTLNMAVSRLDYRSVIINKIGVQAQHDTAGNAQCKVAVEDSHCSGFVTATAHFPDILHQPARVEYRVEGKLHDDNIVRWLNQNARQSFAAYLSGCAAAVDVVAAGTSLLHLPNSGQGTITCSNIVLANNATIPPITIKTGLSGQLFTISALWNNVLEMNGTGTIMR